MAGVTTSATYYSDVRVPAANLVGEENQGWPLITNQLNHERVALDLGGAGAGRARGGTGVGRHDEAGGRPAGDRREWVRLNLARVHAKAEFLKLMNWRIASAGPVRPGSGLGHEGVRDRVRGRGVPAADGSARPARAGALRLSRARRWRGGSSGCTGPRSS